MKILKSLCIVLALFALTSCAAAPPDPNTNDKNDNRQNTAVSRRSKGIDILGRAAYNVFTEKTSAPMSVREADAASGSDFTADENTDRKNDYLRISYPYDYIKISAAKKYRVSIPAQTDETALTPVSDLCGLGNLEVVVADFTTYCYLSKEYVEQTGSEALIESVNDTLISVKGTKGYYTILSNSYSFAENATTTIFSSHKTLGKDSIGKDFEPPIYGIRFIGYADGRGEISFSESNGAASFGDFDNTSVFPFDYSDHENIEREFLYSVMSLTQLPEITINVRVIEAIAEKNLLVVTCDSAVQYVKFDEYTENMPGSEETLRGRYLEVSYDYLFEGYSPSLIYANSIKLRNFN